tara:strand:+ start:339 stop:560 length:222 start_codon:yes stop_codon:yes gene_type:complete
MDQLKREDRNAVRLEIFQDIMMANTRAERLGSNYKPIITTKKFTEEEFARFGGVQSRLDAVVYDTTLRLSERG